jgi:hypothetical protein
MRVPIYLTVVSLAGCYTLTWPVESIGENSYTVTVHSHYQFHSAKVDAVERANSYCGSKGMVAVVNQTKNESDMTVHSAATVQFSCFLKDDPAYQAATSRPNTGASTGEQK